MVVEAIAKRHGFAPWRRRFQGVAAEGAIGGERVLLLLPGTFMNESGRAVAEAMHFYKLAAVRHRGVPRRARSAAGQGAGEDRRRRRRPQRPALDHRRISATTTAGCASASAIPASRSWCIAYVLSDFAKSERAWVEALCDVIADNAELLAQGKDASFQNKVHLAMAAKGFGATDETDERQPTKPARD